MTTTVFLIRHAAHGHLENTLTGRMEEVELTAEGMRQAERLGERLKKLPLMAVHSSPSLRAQQTAQAIARAHRLEVQTVDWLAEIDFGAWTGRSFAELDADPRWRNWNEQRGTAAAPDGETMLAVQERAWRHVAETAPKVGEAMGAMVSHCDVIRAVIAKALGLTLNNLLRFDIAPASVSKLAVGSWGETVISINEQAA